MRIYSIIKSFIKGRAKSNWVFFYKEGGPNGMPYSLITYHFFPRSATGIVPLERAKEVARDCQGQDFAVVINRTPKGEELPSLLTDKEMETILEGDKFQEIPNINPSSHPGWDAIKHLAPTLEKLKR